jgi:glycosyltransferase involved in cell wall biosynthesis
VLVASEFVRHDVINAFGIEPERVAVVHPGSPLPPAVARVENASPFALFPAQTWQHKNHARLIDALAILRSRGTDVTLVCPGQPNVRDREVSRHAQLRGVKDLIQFPGFVSAEQLADLFSAARCLVFPSLFEGFGFPVLEAFVAGVPVACSNTTSLPEVAGDAAVLFDPTDAEAIADAVGRLWTDDSLRATLAERGTARAQLYTWDNLARSCRALYRAAAGQTLDPTDVLLLGAADVSP